jgi:membrane protease YdiL (CAAX protease family)
LRPLAEFLRSIIPADPFQLLFLAGVVCLVVAHGSRWWNVGPFAALGVFSIIFAGAAGYFVCFWPGSHPVRRILGLVFLPTMAGLGLMFTYLAYLSGPSSSVLESAGSVVTHRIQWLQTTLWKLPQGFQFSLAGLVLIVIFTSRLAFGIATLPLALPGRRDLQSEGLESEQRLQFLIWFLISLAFLPGAFLSILTIGAPFLLTSRLPFSAQSAWFPRLTSIVEAIVVFGIALYISGRDGRATIRRSIWLPDLKWTLLAVAFPASIDIFISAGQYLLDRAHWAAHDFGKFASPQIGSYFDVPSIWFFLLFFSAFFEEAIFRGLLQTRFIQKYGMYRGIFLVGIVWAAFHFFSDFSFVRFTDQEVFVKLGFRIFMCVTLNFVLAWLTLRSESVVPAAIAHTLFNVLVLSPLGPPFEGKDVSRVALWAALAYSLFRYWPVLSESSLASATTAASREPAAPNHLDRAK